MSIKSIFTRGFGTGLGTIKDIVTRGFSSGLPKSTSKINWMALSVDVEDRYEIYAEDKEGGAF